MENKEKTTSFWQYKAGNNAKIEIFVCLQKMFMLSGLSVVGAEEIAEKILSKVNFAACPETSNNGNL